MKIKPIHFYDGVPYVVVTGKGSGGMVRKGDILLRSGWVQWFPNGRGYPPTPETPGHEIDRLSERDHHKIVEVEVLGILETAARLQ